MVVRAQVGGRILRRRATTASECDGISENGIAQGYPVAATKTSPPMRHPARHWSGGRIRRCDSLPANPELPIEDRTTAVAARGTVGRSVAAPPVSKERLPERYEVQQAIGKGSYGVVCVALDRESQRLVAVKKVPKVFRDLLSCKRILREIAILARLRHPSVVRLFEVAPLVDVSTFDELHIVMELADSDLGRLLRADVALAPEHTTTLMYNLVVGVKYLHSAGIIHRDLKPANCLVNKDCSVKVCDFGLSRTVPLGSTGASSGGAPGSPSGRKPALQRRLTTHVATRWYRAPELILLQEDYTEAVDVWSLGCIYAELLGMHEETKPQDRRPLFPGGSCYPLSPVVERMSDYMYHSQETSDQLNMIFNLLGTPGDDDASFVGGADARAYLRCYKQREGEGLRCRFPDASDKAMEVLEASLCFDPRKRFCMPQLLNLGVFADVRDPALEEEAPAVVRLDFEDGKELDEWRLRSCLFNEIANLRRDRCAILAGA